MLGARSLNTSAVKRNDEIVVGRAAFILVEAAKEACDVGWMNQV